MRAPADFAIPVDLLSDAAAPLAWANLGDWTATQDYSQACRQLALRVGAAAALQPQDRVLDLACGEGASLRLWPEAFGVTRVTGLEYQARCVERIRRHAPAALETIVQGRFDEWPAPAALRAQVFDAVVCVDAAYHARSLAAFAGFAAALLRPQGRFAFTTLLEDAPRPDRVSPQRLVMVRAGIPAASVLTATELQAALAQQGFSDISLQLLDAEVLQGFADFVSRRAAELPWRRKLGAGWLKIQATAWLCRQVYRSGSLHYSLVSATRRCQEPVLVGSPVSGQSG
ncbi:MAG: SAM-dependent methyltransferase [Moraxellaceae bacterium]|jgi:SAM-dependent methyltransferase|nr:SAM-dependent methyltransferase [Moraxellaceae bacterium]